MTQVLYAHMNNKRKKIKNKIKLKKKRKCGIYAQWNFTQPQRRMKFCHLQVNGCNQ
jgi:hypothetical protein